MTKALLKAGVTAPSWKRSSIIGAVLGSASQSETQVDFELAKLLIEYCPDPHAFSLFDLLKPFSPPPYNRYRDNRERDAARDNPFPYPANVAQLGKMLVEKGADFEYENYQNRNQGYQTVPRYLLHPMARDFPEMGEKRIEDFILEPSSRGFHINISLKSLNEIFDAYRNSSNLPLKSGLIRLILGEEAKSFQNISDIQRFAQSSAEPILRALVENNPQKLEIALQGKDVNSIKIMDLSLLSFAVSLNSGSSTGLIHLLLHKGARVKNSDEIEKSSLAIAAMIHERPRPDEHSQMHSLIAAFLAEGHSPEDRVKHVSEALKVAVENENVAAAEDLFDAFLKLRTQDSGPEFFDETQTAHLAQVLFQTAALTANPQTLHFVLEKFGNSLKDEVLEVARKRIRTLAHSSASDELERAEYLIHDLQLKHRNRAIAACTKVPNEIAQLIQDYDQIPTIAEHLIGASRN